MNNKKITIFGSGKAHEGDASYELAYEVGKMLAQEGFTVVNGGYGGTMEAGAKGAREAGGKTIGVTCTAFSRNSSNPYISKEIQTSNFNERVSKLIELGEAYVAVPGGTGTLVEVAMVWEYQNKGFTQESKPIILVSEFWKSLVKMMADEDPKLKRFVDLVENPEEVINSLIDNL